MMPPSLYHRKWQAILLLLTCLTQLCQAKDHLYIDLPEGETADPIIEFTDELEDKEMPPFVQSDWKEHRIVEFYSPTCPHCIHFAPTYIQFARHFHNLTSDPNTLYAGIKVQFYAVSCKQYKKVCRKQGANSYPTLKAYVGGSDRSKVIHQTELHPMTIIKALGMGLVDDEWQEQEEDNDKALVPYYMPRSQAQIYSDAYLTFFHALKDSIFLENGPLPKTRGQAIKQWLTLLNKVLPPWRLDWIGSELLEAFKENAASEQAWNSVVDTYPPRQTEWSPACQHHDSPYTCGLWTLFHIVTVGVVEYNRGILQSDTAIKRKAQTTPNVAIMLREYVHHFFLCEECSTHFVQSYDQCDYKRCERLTHTKVSLEEWRELPLWLLEFHNGVNVRLLGERYEREGRDEPPTVQEEQTVLWPPVQECPFCWKNVAGAKSKYNPQVIYNYMRLIYWPEDGATLAFKRQLESSIAEYERNPNFHQEKASSRRTQKRESATRTGDQIPTMEGPYVLIGVMVCGLWMVVLWRKFQMDKVLGIHRSKLHKEG